MCLWLLGQVGQPLSLVINDMVTVSYKKVPCIDEQTSVLSSLHEFQLWSICIPLFHENHISDKCKDAHPKKE